MPVCQSSSLGGLNRSYKACFKREFLWPESCPKNPREVVAIVLVLPPTKGNRGDAVGPEPLQYHSKDRETRCRTISPWTLVSPVVSKLHQPLED